MKFNIAIHHDGNEAANAILIMWARDHQQDLMDRLVEEESLGLETEYEMSVVQVVEQNTLVAETATE